VCGTLIIIIIILTLRLNGDQIVSSAPWRPNVRHLSSFVLDTLQLGVVVSTRGAHAVASPSSVVGSRGSIRSISSVAKPRYSVSATPFASSQDRTSWYTSPVVSHIPQTKLLPDSEARPSLIHHRKTVNLAVLPCCRLTRMAAGPSPALASRSWKHRKARTKN
jgi:hypothetical protein